MTFTSYSKRSIADQTGVTELSFYAALSNTTGSGSVGLSGTNDFSFSFANGRILSPRGEYVASYEAGKGFYIHSQVGRGVMEYDINSSLVGLGQPWATGRFSWVVVNASGVTLEADISVKGNTPSYSITDRLKYTSNQPNITGYINNNNSYGDFRVFSIEMLNNSSPYFISSLNSGNISGGYSGAFVLRTTGSGFADSLVSTKWHTNFGSFDVSLMVTGDGYAPADSHINIAPNYGYIFNTSSMDYVVSLSNYPSTGVAQVSLSFLSGVTGAVWQYNDATSYISHLITGGITGVSYLSQQETGTVSGWDSVASVWRSAPGTGYLYSSVIAATGNVSKVYSVRVTGYGVSGLTSGIPAFGYVSFTGSGNVLPSSGSWLVPSQWVVGNPSVLYRSSPPSGFVQSTGWLAYNTPTAWDSLYINGQIIQFSTGSSPTAPAFYTGLNDLCSVINSYSGLFGLTGLVAGAGIKLFALASGESGNGISLASSGSASRPAFSYAATTGGSTSYYILSADVGMPTPSGFLSADYIPATGWFTQTGSGYLTGQVATVDYSRDFSGVWGIQVYDTIYQTGSGWYDAISGYSSAFVSGRGYPVSGQTTLYITVSYSNFPYVISTDMATLSISLYSAEGGSLITGHSMTLKGA